MLLASEKYRDQAMAVWSGTSMAPIFAGTSQHGFPFAATEMSHFGGGGGARTYARRRRYGRHRVQHDAEHAEHRGPGSRVPGALSVPPASAGFRRTRAIPRRTLRRARLHDLRRAERRTRGPVRRHRRRDAERDRHRAAACRAPRSGRARRRHRHRRAHRSGLSRCPTASTTIDGKLEMLVLQARAHADGARRRLVPQLAGGRRLRRSATARAARVADDVARGVGVGRRRPPRSTASCSRADGGADDAPPRDARSAIRAARLAAIAARPRPIGPLVLHRSRPRIATATRCTPTSIAT